MFDVEAWQLINGVVTGDWYFVTCASFEKRWLGLPVRLVNEGFRAPVHAFVLCPDNVGSHWQTICSERQQAFRGELKEKSTWPVSEAAFDLLGSAPWEVAERVAGSLKVRLGEQPGVLVIDVTTMPKLCMFPLLSHFMAMPELHTIIATYTEAEAYHESNIQSEPSVPTPIPPFDYLPHSRLEPIGWIPILGFVPLFADRVYQSLVESHDLHDRIFPIVGLPAIEPTFFERVLTDGARGKVLTALLTNPGARERFLYAGAADPFETRDVIIELVESMPDVHWVGTPLGPKPMAIGMMEAAARLAGRMSIVTSQARTYHPDYSTGAGRIHGYLLKQAGQRL